MNIFNYLYYYNGGGVAIGDLDNDGLPDIYFVSNQGANKLYHNRGDMHFEDITERAGAAGKGNWKTGVALADVNNDGLLDIYVCEVGGYLNLKGRNELYINKGNLHFEEAAHAYGLDVEGFNTQAVFFDYDHDGDLDMFLVNHSVHEASNFQAAAGIRGVHAESSGDKLFRNDSRHFTEVTAAAGIYSSSIGYGLAVSVGDLNNDGWPDIYVSNDFHENDYYYLNNRHGGFTEMNNKAFGHESRFSMGSAIADLNNDGWLDIVTLDMLPEKEKLLKTSAGDDPYDIYMMKHKMGYHFQNSRNCLQLNTGKGLSFSEIGLYSGIAATDWSWSPLADDFDNDGIKDLFISNGIVRRPNDLDFLKFRANAIDNARDFRLDLAGIRSMPEGKISNYLYRGASNLRFTNETAGWGLDQPTISTGAACADLDNDGDLDIVVNNINSEACIYRNGTDRILNGPAHHFLDVRLEGSANNPFGIGARVEMRCKNKLQINEMQSTRGFESSSLQYLHFGTGEDSLIDRIEVRWPDGTIQDLRDLRADRIISLSQANASLPDSLLHPRPIPARENHFSEIMYSFSAPVRHYEDAFNDFDGQPLMPHFVSTEGPRIAVGDVNGDGLPDFFICGAKHQPGQLFVQNREGHFIVSKQPAFITDREGEGVSAIFFDADQDGDQDLYVVTGGDEPLLQDSCLLDRLYLNDGQGNFSRSDGLPLLYGNKSVVAAADLDHDGDIDLFVGGRVVTGRYGEVPESYLLLNDGHGKFSPATDALAPGLRQAGLVTSAAWADMDGDGWQDLVIAGEWMPVTIFKNDKGRLRNVTTDLGLENSTGLWHCLSIADIDGDGRPDIVAGNLGLNSKLVASVAAPLCIYLADYNRNGILQQIMACSRNGHYYPFAGKEELEKQLPWIRKGYPGYASFAGKTMEEVFPVVAGQTHVLKANMLASTVFLQARKDRFDARPLPFETQLAPQYAFLLADMDGDGHTDLLSGGNLFGVKPYEGRYDAMAMSFCPGNGKGRFSSVGTPSGLPEISGQIRDLQPIRIAGKGMGVLIARNDDTVVVWRPQYFNERK